MTPAPLRALVVGYSWTEGRPVLRIRVEGEWKLREWPLRFRVRLVVTDERRCVGYADGTGLVPCPDKALPSGQQCKECERRDAFRPCMTCDGFRCPTLTLTPAMKKSCDREHHMYLACFGQPKLKVGTCSHRRRDQRIIEQGPLAAARVARGRGPLIKQIETTLAGHEDFVELMRRDRKALLLHASMTEDEARARIREIWQTLKGRLPQDLATLIHQPIFVHPPPLAQKARGWPVVPMPVEAGTLIEGTLAGAIGHLVFLHEQDGRFALDMAALKTRIVELDPPEGEGRKPTVQLGLF